MFLPKIPTAKRVSVEREYNVIDRKNVILDPNCQFG